MLTRPSLQLCVTLKLANVPLGTKVYTHRDDAGRHYDSCTSEAWEVAFGEVVGYGTTPAKALDEFDERSSYASAYASAYEERSDRFNRENP